VFHCSAHCISFDLVTQTLEEETDIWFSSWRQSLLSDFVPLNTSLGVSKLRSSRCEIAGNGNILQKKKVIITVMMMMMESALHVKILKTSKKVKKKITTWVAITHNTFWLHLATKVNAYRGEVWCICDVTLGWQSRGVGGGGLITDSVCCLISKRRVLSVPCLRHRVNTFCVWKSECVFVLQNRI
jgi:hypothetical protein